MRDKPDSHYYDLDIRAAPNKEVRNVNLRPNRRHGGARVSAARVLVENAAVALFGRYINAMNARDYDALRDILTEDHVWHGIMNDSHGVDGFETVLREYTGGLPDVVMEIVHVFAGQGYIGARVIHRGTHTGDSWGPPTGKPVEFPLHVHARIIDGKLAEVWEQWNLTSFRRQLGREGA